MAARRDVPPVGPGAALEKWLLRIGVVGLFFAAPGVAVGYFEGFQEETEAGAFAWVMVFFGGLLMGITAWVGLLRRLDPESRRERRRRMAVRRTRQAPLPAPDLTYEALLRAAERLSGGVGLRPAPPVSDSRRQLVWWRSRDLLAAFDLPGGAASIVFVAALGLSDVVSHFFSSTGFGWFSLVLAAVGVALIVFQIRDVRAVARVAVSEHVRPMRWLLLREPYGGEAYLVLYRADGDPDEAPPMLLRLAKKRQARRLPPAGVAEVHGSLRPVTWLVPWIDGSPVWTSHPVTALDLTTERDRARLTYLIGPETHRQ
ncbi:hypothetical protein ACWD4J_28690 [Streptomyces sp. NPDC002577]